MPPIMDAAAEQRLRDYFDRVGQVLGNDARRASFAIYNDESDVAALISAIRRAQDLFEGRQV